MKVAALVLFYQSLPITAVDESDNVSKDSASHANTILVDVEPNTSSIQMAGRSGQLQSYLHSWRIKNWGNVNSIP